MASPGSPYKSARWAREKAAFLARPENRLCACGCGRKAAVVDHRQPWKGNLTLFWDRTNWQGLAWPCHSRKTARQDGGFGRSVSGPHGCDHDGMPLDPAHPWNVQRNFVAQSPGAGGEGGLKVETAARPEDRSDPSYAERRELEKSR